MTTNFPHDVEQLFKNACDRTETFRENPVTGSSFVTGLDPVRPQKLMAERALAARDWFEGQKPEGAPELPLTYEERESIKVTGLPYIISLFARSIAARDYRFEGHPTFEIYARGVMASELTPYFVKEDAELLRWYPPASLDGMGPGLMWRGQ